MLYRWEFKKKPAKGVSSLLSSWMKRLNISKLLACILWNRGLRSLEEVAVFLSPNLRHLKPLSSVENLEPAAKFIADALKKDVKIAIWGDYDVDGITATSILMDFFRKKGFSPIYHIPNRLTHGYGLNIDGLKELVAQGVKCLITVDCGITNIDEVKWLREQDVDVIITDHHMALDTLPPANYIINPKLNSTAYKNIAGVGVSFLLAAALNRELPHKIDIRQYLDLVAIGTIADVVPMDIDNRILVKNGLLLLSESRRPGLVALKEVSGLKVGSRIGTEEIAFILAPRINAAGRMGDGHEGVELLLSSDIDGARKLAKRLEQYNKERKREEDRIFKRAVELARDKLNKPGLVLFGEDWHEGVIGIVASKICEKYYRPTFLLTGNNGYLKGSGRSIPEINLYSLIKRCAKSLEKYGGHPQAGGISLKKANLEQFEEMFIKSIEDVTDKLPIPTLSIEASLSFKDIDYTLLKELEMLEPFGPGNPEPVFMAENLLVTKQKRVGNEHVFLEIRDEVAKKTMWSKGWKMAGIFPDNLLSKYVKIAFYPRISTYNGLIGIDLQLKDIDII